MECKGGAPNYALTQYFFHLYEIKLSTSGYFALLNQIETNDHLLECSLSEVANGKTTDKAKTLDIKVIYDDFDNDRIALKHTLEVMEPSYKNHYVFNDEKNGLIFSLENNFKRGLPGKEKTILQDLAVDQKSLLLALATHGKGLSMELKDPETVMLHEFGWLEIHDDILHSELLQLSEHLRKVDCPIIEITESNYFRLSVAPELIYFDPNYFECCLKQRG